MKPQGSLLAVLSAWIVKRRREFTIDVSFQLEAGAAVGVFGGSGEGKSSILSCIAGLEQPDRGEVRVGDQILHPPPAPLHLRPIGYLTQKDNLFGHLSVQGNVCFGLPGTQDVEQEGWIAELRDTLGLNGLWHASIRQLSGGQARRVALARMLARRPRVVLLDEPFAGLDRHVVRELVAALANWRSQLGFSLLAVDHQAQLLERLCPRTLAIERGRIVHDGPWDALRRAPATHLLQRLLE